MNRCEYCGNLLEGVTQFWRHGEWFCANCPEIRWERRMACQVQW